MCFKEWNFFLHRINIPELESPVEAIGIKLFFIRTSKWIFQILPQLQKRPFIGEIRLK